MSLADLASEITSGVQQTAQQGEIRGRLTQLKSIQSSLDELTPIVQETVGLVGAAAAVGVDINTDRFEALQARVRRAGQTRLDLPVLERLILDIRTEASSVKSVVTASWRELVDRMVPQRQGLKSLVDAYLRLDPLNALARALRRAVDAAEGLLGTSPSLDAFKRLNELALEIPELRRNLVGDDPAIRAFVDRAARGGASLDDLTPEVERWIDSKGFMGFFKITIGEPES